MGESNIDCKLFIPAGKLSSATLHVTCEDVERFVNSFYGFCKEQKKKILQAIHSHRCMWLLCIPSITLKGMPSAPEYLSSQVAECLMKAVSCWSSKNMPGSCSFLLRGCHCLSHQHSRRNLTCSHGPFAPGMSCLSGIYLWWSQLTSACCWDCAWVKTPEGAYKGLSSQRVHKGLGVCLCTLRRWTTTKEEIRGEFC